MPRLSVTIVLFGIRAGPTVGIFGPAPVPCDLLALGPDGAAVELGCVNLAFDIFVAPT